MLDFRCRSVLVFKIFKARKTLKLRQVCVEPKDDLRNSYIYTLRVRFRLNPL